MFNGVVDRLELARLLAVLLKNKSYTHILGYYLIEIIIENLFHYADFQVLSPLSPFVMVR